MDAPTLTRRQLLQSAALAAAWAALSACTSNPNPARGTPTNGESAPVTLPSNLLPATSTELHLLRRISFGPKPGDIDRVKSIGLSAYLDEQLNYETLADAEDRLANLDLLTMPAADLIDKEKAKELRPAQLLSQLTAAKLLRALYSQQQLREVMVDFWSDHFNIYALKSTVGLFLPADQRDVIRAHALGKFRDLLAASAHSPAMLLYLDNATSLAKAPNENYAREVMELHTLSVTGGYTQQDVHDVARALTGWSVAGPQDEMRLGRDRVGAFVYRPAIHDNGAKTILGVAFPAGGGQSDGDKVIDLLAAHPSTAKFIAAKLCRHFVADDPPQSIVDKATAVFTQNDGDIRSVMRTILTSDEFGASAGQKFKRPFDLIASALRALSAQTAIDSSPAANKQAVSNPLYQYLATLGHIPFLWPTPDGYPDKTVSWLSTNGMLGRWNFGLALAGGPKNVSIDSQSLVGSTKSPEELVDRVSNVLLGASLPDEARSIMIDYAQSAPDKIRLQGVTALMIGSPHFQVK